jgi:hypothetical protein
MNKKASILYFSFAPLLFLLSYYISYKVFVNYMLNGTISNEAHNRPWIYSGFLTFLYIGFYFVIKDIYRPSGPSNSQ